MLNLVYFKVQFSTIKIKVNYFRNAIKSLFLVHFSTFIGAINSVFVIFAIFLRKFSSPTISDAIKNCCFLQTREPQRNNCNSMVLLETKWQTNGN